MPVEALIFDLDGTLVDTAPDLIQATNHVLHSIGRRPVSYEEFRGFVGQGAMNLIERGTLATGGAVDPKTLKRLHGEFLDYYGRNISIHSKVFDGIPALLDEAQSRGLKFGVCTNKVEGLSHKLLREIGLSKWFEVVVGGDTLPIMKPNPAPYREVAKRLGVDAARTIMFGDSETDIRTAQNTGVPVIAVSFGYTAQPVQTFDPTHVIDHYDEAWGIVQRYL
ncbi:MAG: phosphoglycolate phosphatase [Alphaproteobacteria bacterium]|nr:phosphoglycolate phosphatase [Alphaproteobacteria bacterium]